MSQAKPTDKAPLSHRKVEHIRRIQYVATNAYVYLGDLLQLIEEDYSQALEGCHESSYKRALINARHVANTISTAARDLCERGAP